MPQQHAHLPPCARRRESAVRASRLPQVLILLVVASTASSRVSAQLAPVREFCTVNRPVPITISVPAAVAPPLIAPPLVAPQPATTAPVPAPSGLSEPTDAPTKLAAPDEPVQTAEPGTPLQPTAGGEPQPTRTPPPPPARIEIEVILAATGEVIDRSTAAAGESDLARLFPRLWQSDDKRALLAQLRIDGKRIGAPLIMTPMFSPPPYAPRLDRAGFPMFPPPNAARAAPTFSGYRVSPMRLLVLDTTKGELRFALRSDLAPNTVYHFSHLVSGGMYTDTEFHKIASLAAASSPDFVQTGDPTGTGLGGAGFLIDLEDSTLRHEFGVISMARASDPNSASSQFFISLGGSAAATLDGKYAAFGQLVSGADVLRAIAASPVGPDNRPLVPPRIVSAKLVDAPPLGDGPPPARDPLGQRPKR